MNSWQLSAANTWKRWGYGNQPYIIYRHEDICRPHIHIVSLRIDEQGKKINDYKEWQRSTAVCRELERKYSLLPAERQDQRESLPLTVVDYRKGDIKHQIANVVKPVMQGYKFQSIKEFKALLGLFHVTVEETHKTIDGKTYHGLVYIATDEKGERVGVAIKSIKIGKSVGYEALRKKFVKSKQWIFKHPVSDRTKDAIATALRQDTRQGFLQALETQGIAAVLYQNGAGVIYGVTYIDHASKTVFKGSLLGKRIFGIGHQPAVRYSSPPKRKRKHLSCTRLNRRGKSRDWWKCCWTYSHRSPIPIRQKTCPKALMEKKKKRRRRGPRLG